MRPLFIDQFGTTRSASESAMNFAKRKSPRSDGFHRAARVTSFAEFWLIQILFSVR